MLRIAEFLPFGVLIGLLARLVATGDPRRGWRASMVAGGVGALAGGLAGRFLTLTRDEAPRGFAMSLLGAFAVAIAFHVLSSSRVRA